MIDKVIMANINDEWENFCDNEYDECIRFKNMKVTSSKADANSDFTGLPPKSNNLYISTQTVISYLDTDIQLNDVFWKLPVIPYHLPQEGIVKKQIKFNSNTQEAVDEINLHIKNYYYVDEYIINHIDNPVGRIKFKDVRKISIGISKKDIISYRSKKKSAFYNCFVIILRLLHNDLYKEVHVKIFNTGKLEIPGIQNVTILNKVYTLLVDMIKPYIKKELSLAFILLKTHIVLINSNFNCGYYLKRDVLNNLFKKKYNDKIRSSYDPCTYPGIQCEIYYNLDSCNNGIINALSIADMKVIKNIVKVSFMVFRTGSVLIVGKCSEGILQNIYDYLCTIFTNEYSNIHEININKVLNNTEPQKRNSRIKLITVNNY
jgi:hypothetical protein